MCSFWVDQLGMVEDPHFVEGVYDCWWDGDPFPYLGEFGHEGDDVVGDVLALVVQLDFGFVQNVELSESGEVGGCFFWEVCNAGVSKGFALDREECLGDVPQLVCVVQGPGEGGHCDLSVFCHEGVDP